MPITRYHPRTGDRVDLDGARLAELRHGLGLTLADVAARTECSIAALSQWEHEVTVPGPEARAALGRLYGDALRASGAVVVKTWVDCEHDHLDQRYHQRMSDPDAE